MGMGRREWRRHWKSGCRIRIMIWGSTKGTWTVWDKKEVELREGSRLPAGYSPETTARGAVPHFLCILNNIIHLLIIISAWTALNNFKWTGNHINYENNIQDTVWTGDIWIDSSKPCGEWAGSQLILELARINFWINLEPSLLAA